MHLRLWALGAGLVFTFVGLAWENPANNGKKTEAAYREGLKLWRKPGAIAGGAACNSCHGPDGLEIALYDFSDADIYRRAFPHLGDQDSKDTVKFIHAVRDKYHITHLMDPMLDRPLQPGGRPLPGATPEERDLAFAKVLAQRMPFTLTGEVNSLADAEKVKKEYLQIDLWNLPVGIPFSRISEDIFHGKEHASLAHWMADTPQALNDQLPELNRLEDQYLDAPTEQNLALLLDQLDPKGRDMKQIDFLGSVKLKSLFIFQHLKRKELLGQPSRPTLLIEPFKQKTVDDNPMWHVADFARTLHTIDPQDLAMDQNLLEKKSGGPTIGEQMVQLTLPWMWLGWMCDPGLQQTSYHNQTRNGEYFQQALWEDGPYAVHGGFENIRRLLSVAYQPGLWNNGIQPQHLMLITITHRRNDLHLANEPKDPEHKKLYSKLMCNSYRAMMHLYIDQMKKTNIVWSRDIARQECLSMVTYMHYAQPDHAQSDDALVAQLNEIAKGCNERLH